MGRAGLSCGQFAHMRGLKNPCVCIMSYLESIMHQVFVFMLMIIVKSDFIIDLSDVPIQVF